MDTQKLQEALALHKRWVENYDDGVRLDLQGKNLEGVDLKGACLDQALMAGANLRGADLQEANLYRADLKGACLDGANLLRASLQATVLEEASLIKANLRAVNASGANLRKANLTGANLSDADFRHASLDHARMREVSLCHSVMVKAELYCVDLEGAVVSRVNFQDARLQKVDFSVAKKVTVCNFAGAYLKGANFWGVDLNGHIFNRAHLSGTLNLPETPVVENLDGKILKAIEQGTGRLDMSAWHTCDTTHCRAGWAVILAGPEGKDLEERFGTGVAGALIYNASTGRVPDFYASDEEALRDIKDQVIV